MYHCIHGGAAAQNPAARPKKAPVVEMRFVFRVKGSDAGGIHEFREADRHAMEDMIVSAS